MPEQYTATTETYEVTYNVVTPMRDGTRLRADVYLPKDQEGPFPTLVCRTPYDKSRKWGVPEYEGLVNAGYAVVAQDMRGRWASEGEWIPFFVPGWTDAEDGYDTIEWAAEQTWSNGKIGTFGNSYRSWTQWALAPTRPPHLEAMWAGGMGPRTTDLEVGGVLRTGRVIQLVFGMLATDTQKWLEKSAGPDNVDWWESLHDTVNRDKWMWFLPYKDLPEEALGGLGDYFKDWLANHQRETWRFDDDFPKIDIPVFHRTGWYDRLVGAAKMFSGMQQNAASETARANQRLIIGPWAHDNNNTGKWPEFDFGPAAEVPNTDLQVNWFDYWLKGIDNGVMDAAPAQIFLMGANEWKSAQEWPPAEAQEVSWHLSSGTGANTPDGDGELTPEISDSPNPDRYSYDPRDPVMSVYGVNTHDAPRDLRVMDHRRDILVYQSAPLDNAVDVAGYPKVTLWASSDALDTDFIVRLVDVHPDGFAQNLCYGILRARFREGLDSPKLLTPGELYELEIDMLPTCNRFLAGHRIRLDVTSSDFPNFDRNHNTGGEDWAESDLRVARQTVFHDAVRPSRLTLPVMQGDWGD